MSTPTTTSRIFIGLLALALFLPGFSIAAPELTPTINSSVRVAASDSEPSFGESIRERIRARMNKSSSTDNQYFNLTTHTYAANPRAQYDVYVPKTLTPTHWIVFVHGGAWMAGDKRMGAASRAQYYTQRSVGFVSINYPMLPSTPVKEQAQFLWMAMGHLKTQLPKNSSVHLMGHSAGGHLVALMHAQHPEAYWKSTTVLDSGALDIEHLMQNKHYPFHDKAFGSDLNYWRQISPVHQTTTRSHPILLVCSTTRDLACDQAERYARTLTSKNSPVRVSPFALSHDQINDLVGTSTPNALNTEVENFWRQNTLR